MPPTRWVTFATAPDQLTAEMWRDLVRQAGVQCTLQPADAIGFLGVSATPVRLIARAPDAARARSALDAQLGGEACGPISQPTLDDLRDPDLS